LTRFAASAFIEHMFDLAELRERLQRLVAGLDADVIDPAAAERLVTEFSTIEHVAAAGKAIAARRVAESGRWRRSGERTEAEWLARATGDSVGSARAALETATVIDALPAVSAALRSGTLSAPQATAIASAASADPSAESRLLAMAERAPLTKLRNECDRVRAAATPDLAERHRRIHQARYWRQWTDREGARCGQYRLTPERAAVLEAAAQPFVEAAFRQARAEQRQETSEAYAADGLVAMASAVRAGDVTPPTKPGWPKAEMIAIVNVESLRRGSVDVGAGETCEIAGVGPVPVEVARELFGESLLKIVIRDGVDIRTVVHAGRHPNAAQRTAIFVRDGGRCVRPTCRRPMAEIDHIADYRWTRHTTLDELAGLCRHDHTLKTRGGHRYRRGEHGWEWRLPDGTIEYEHAPNAPPCTG
jgi:hypothetical protein